MKRLKSRLERLNDYCLTGVRVMKRYSIKILSFVLVLLLLPVFAGSICPCVHAAPASYPVFQKAACHGYCVEMNASPSDCEKQPEIQAAIFPASENLTALLQSQKTSGEVFAAKVLDVNVSPAPEEFFPLFPLLHTNLFFFLS